MEKIKFIVLASNCDGCAAANNLKQKGYDVTVGETADESKEVKDGTKNIRHLPIKELVRALLNVKNKDEYFIYCDDSSLYQWAEALQKTGFKNGIFPSKSVYEFEENSYKAFEFLKKACPGINEETFEEKEQVQPVDIKTLTIEQEKAMLEQFRQYANILSDSLSKDKINAMEKTVQSKVNDAVKAEKDNSSKQLMELQTKHDSEVSEIKGIIKKIIND